MRQNFNSISCSKTNTGGRNNFNITTIPYKKIETTVKYITEERLHIFCEYTPSTYINPDGLYYTPCALPL